MTGLQQVEELSRRRDFGPLLNPRSVAVVGANERLESFTGGTVVNLRSHGFKGAVYPVNPRLNTVAGYPSYSDLASLPAPIDLSIVVVRADRAIQVLQESVTAGARAAILVSSGFGEGAADARGRERAAELASFLKVSPIPVLGPSTAGLVNLNDCFVPRAATNQLRADLLKPGPVALVSQSGAANNAVFNRAHAHGVRIGLAVATGVQANVTLWDIARAAVADRRIRVITMIVEELGHPDEYEPVLRAAAESSKPVVVLRTGRSDRGRTAVATHTASLAGDWAVERTMLESLGVTLVHDLDQLWEVASIACHWGRAESGPLRVGVIGLSGGEGALIADQASDLGLDIAPVSPEFQHLVSEKLSLAGAGNPFDPSGEMMGAPQEALDAVTGFVTMNDYDVTLVALNVQPAPPTDGMVDRILNSLNGVPGRVALSYWDAQGVSDGLLDRLLDHGGPVLPGSHRLLAALAAWASGGSPVREPVTTSAAQRLSVGSEPTYWQARGALAALGMPFPEARLVLSAAEAVEAAEQVGYPVVLKANVVSTVHKAAAGLVKMGVSDRESCAAVFADLSSHGAGVVVEETVVAIASMILGTTFDDRIGPAVVVGSGGAAVEQLDDVVALPTRVMNHETVRRAVAGSAIGLFLQTRHPADFERVAELVHVLGRAVADSAVAIDVNPIVLTAKGVLALDARVDTRHVTST